MKWHEANRLVKDVVGPKKAAIWWVISNPNLPSQMSPKKLWKIKGMRPKLIRLIKMAHKDHTDSLITSVASKGPSPQNIESTPAKK